jgi:three-Cys-motif partner protein
VKGDQLSLFDQQPEDPNNFFSRKRHWSAAKHRILLRYLQSHCYNLGGDKSYQSKYINYVDGFAGAGKYGEGIGIEDFVKDSKFWANKYNHGFENTDGSPLIALKCAKLFNQEERVNLRCFFIEAKPSSNKKLKENCQLVGKDLFYKIYDPKKFEVAFPEVMNDLNNYPTLFFLDTFGVKGFTFDQICSIGNYVRQHKGELFFLFHNRSVARNAGYSTISSQNNKMQKAAETYVQNLTALLGANSEQDWKHKWLELKDQPQSFERWALEYFKNRIRKESGFRGVTSFEIKEKYSDNRPQYSIVVGSNHPEKAFGEFLNEFVWEEERLLFFKENATKEVQKFLEKEWENENTRRIEKIKPDALEILRDLRPKWISFKDAITKIILGITDLGSLKRTQYYNEILASLYKEGMLEIRNPGSKKPYTLDSLLRIVK